jgi:hypothetical protein
LFANAKEAKEQSGHGVVSCMGVASRAIRKAWAQPELVFGYGCVILLLHRVTGKDPDQLMLMFKLVS